MNFKKEIEKVRTITYKEILKKPLIYFRALNFHGLEPIVIIIIIGRHAHVCIEPTSLNFTDTSRSDKLDLNKCGDTSELTLAEEQERRTGPLF